MKARIIITIVQDYEINPTIYPVDIQKDFQEMLNFDVENVKKDPIGSIEFCADQGEEMKISVKGKLFTEVSE